MDTVTPGTPPPGNRGGSAAPRIHALVLFGAAFLLITIAAFAVGLSIGSKVKEVQQGDDSGTPTDDTNGSDEPSNAGELSIDWWQFTKFAKRPYDPTLYLETTLNQDLMIESTGAMTMGQVVGGEYDGWHLVANTLGTAGMGTYYTTVYTFNSPEVDMSGNSSEVAILSYPVISGFFGATGSVRTFAEAYSDSNRETIDVEIDGLIPDETVESNGVTYVFEAMGEHTMYPETINVREMEYVSNSKYGPVYQYKVENGEDVSFSGVRNAFFVVTAEGRIAWYDIAIPFWNSDDRRSGVPSVVIAGQTNSDTYLKGSVGGCGFRDMSYVVDEVPELTPVGYALGDESVKIYEPKNYALEMFDDEFRSWSAMNDGVTREQFATIHPFFFYQDDLGRWIQFTKVDVVPPGECGKPVIYLYPESTMDIAVNLQPFGGFTVTEPAYNGGWQVKASPDGTLVNQADGETYPYLFWEGRGAGYEAPKQYWVVAREDVHDFLVGTLAELGLNDKETADFLEFWEPRMQAAPYYKIGFHGNEVMNLIAPLRLSTKADVLVRILMDYSELDAPIVANPPILPPTPERDGFTVIEWGGVIR